ncbi:MAG: hypothetical protein WBW81_00495, partial [Methylocella sp.]
MSTMLGFVPGRLWSLWDIMNEFDLWELGDLISKLERAATVLELAGSNGKRAIHEPTLYRFNLELINEVVTYAEAHDFNGCLSTAWTSRSHLSIYPDPDISTLAAEVRHVRGALLNEISGRKFLRVASDRSGYIDQEALFGPIVLRSFPSAKLDIREAGNCLAAECGTAAVFHLMRAAEFSLRALARDRRIEFADKPLNEKEWGQILPKLESVVTE